MLGSPPVESLDDIAGRADDMERVKNSVFRRRVAYLFTVALTVLLAVLPVIDWIAARNFWGRVSMTLGIPIPVLLSAPFSELVWVGIWIDRAVAVLQEELSTAGPDFCPRRIRVASHLRLDVPEPRKQNITKPERVWTDPIVYRLRNSSLLVRVYMWISGRFVPMLFALFVAAPVGVLILPFFIPRFIRNAQQFADLTETEKIGVADFPVIFNQGPRGQPRTNAFGR